MRHGGKRGTPSSFSASDAMFVGIRAGNRGEGRPLLLFSLFQRLLLPSRVGLKDHLTTARRTSRATVDGVSRAVGKFLESVLHGTRQGIGRLVP